MKSKKKRRQLQLNEKTKKLKTYTPSHRRSAAVSNFAQEDEGQGEISTNMAIIQRISTLERKVYNLEQHVYGLKH